MRLHCLGTAGYHPSATRHTSCYFLPESGIVLDAGSGLFRLPGLFRGGTLDVLLSHAHLDHTFGLTFLVGILAKYSVERLTIWGEGEKLAAIREHLFHELLFPVPLEAEWKAIDGREGAEIGGAHVSWRCQSHPGGSMAYRLDWPRPAGGSGGEGKSLVYATDTRGDHAPETLRWMGGANLLIHECYFLDAEQAWAERTGHSWSGRVAEIAAATAPERLLLTHIDPLGETDDPVGLVAIDARLPGRVVLARDTMAVDF